MKYSIRKSTLGENSKKMEFSIGFTLAEVRSVRKRISARLRNFSRRDEKINSLVRILLLPCLLALSRLLSLIWQRFFFHLIKDYVGFYFLVINDRCKHGCIDNHV